MSAVVTARFARVVVALVLASLCVSQIVAHQAKAEANRIVGHVKDQAGQPLPGVQITLKSDGQERTTIADGLGEFAFVDVPAGGRVAIRATLIGFQDSARSDITLKRNGPTVVDLR